jgi:hypothetical protein
VRLYRNGFMVSIGSGAQPPTAKRGNAQGWTDAVARRNAVFLMSVDVDALSGVAFALTLTLAPDRIPGPGEFHEMLRVLLRGWRRHGAIRWHWLIEFQRRGTPHLHCSVWMPEGTAILDAEHLLVDPWLSLCGAHDCVAKLPAQSIRRLTDEGWAEYVAKHGSRGAKHYQRDPENRPAGWENPGRMWGYGPRTAWPAPDSAERLPLEADLTTAGVWRLRRLLRSWLIARARRIDDPEERRRAVRWARRSLRCGDRRLSPVRPVSGWWAKVPHGREWALGLALLASEG